jgi:hypothetical protein
MSIGIIVAGYARMARKTTGSTMDLNLDRTPGNRLFKGKATK